MGRRLLRAGLWVPLVLVVAAAGLEARPVHDPAALDDLWVVTVELAAQEGVALLRPHDARAPVVRAEDLAAADGLWRGPVPALQGEAWWVDRPGFRLGLLSMPEGLVWLTWAEGRLVPWAPSGLVATPSPKDVELEVPVDGPWPTADGGTQGDGVLQMMLDADYEFYTALGDGWRDYQLAVMHLVEAIYHHHFLLDFEVVAQHAWTTPEQPVTSIHPCGEDEGEAMVVQFMEAWESIAPTTQDPREVAILFSKKTRLTSLWGCAFIAALESPYAYSVNKVYGTYFDVGGLFADENVPQYLDVNLVAHELGHNSGGLHELALGPTCANGTIMWPTMCFYPPLVFTPMNLAFMLLHQQERI